MECADRAARTPLLGGARGAAASAASRDAVDVEGPQHRLDGAVQVRGDLRVAPPTVLVNLPRQTRVQPLAGPLPSRPPSHSGGPHRGAPERRCRGDRGPPSMSSTRDPACHQPSWVKQPPTSEPIANTVARRGTPTPHQRDTDHGTGEITQPSVRSLAVTANPEGGHSMSRIGDESWQWVHTWTE